MKATESASEFSLPSTEFENQDMMITQPIGYEELFAKKLALWFSSNYLYFFWTQELFT